MAVLNIKALVVHLSASVWGDAKVIRQWHTATPPNGRGWSDIGYHAVILNGKREYRSDYVKELDGKIEPGRPFNIVGAHCQAGGMNSISLGVCLVGIPGHTVTLAEQADVNWFKLGESHRYATKRQVSALVHWLATQCIRYNLNPLGTFKVDGRKINVISQHSDHDKGKPLCASLDMDFVRKMVNEEVKRRQNLTK